MPANRYVLFFSLAIVGLAADLVTKTLVFRSHYKANSIEVEYWWIQDVFGIQTSFNGGAMFGMFQGGSFWLACLSMVALVGLFIWMFIFKMAISRWLTVAMGMITGGILGNLYDRMGFGFVAEHPEHTVYHVRDWIHFRLQGIPLIDPWPNFNIADSLLVTGAIMLFCFAVFVPDPFAAEKTKQEESDLDKPGLSSSKSV